MAAKNWYAKLGDPTSAPIVGARAGEPIVVQGILTMAEAFEANDVGFMCKLPKNHKIVDWYFANTDFDSDGSPAITVNAGRITSAGAIDNNLLTDSTALQGAALTRPTALSAMMYGYFATDQNIGFKIGVAPATGATSGTVVMCLVIAPIQGGETLLT